MRAIFHSPQHHVHGDPKEVATARNVTAVDRKRLGRATVTPMPMLKAQMRPMSVDGVNAP